MKPMKKFILIFFLQILFGSMVFSQATLSIGSVSGTAENEVSVPIMATGLSDLSTFQFTISYDSSILTYVRSENWALGVSVAQIQINSMEGKITFVYYNDEASLSIASGKFFDLVFVVSPNAGGFAPVNWSDTPTPRELSNSSMNIIDCTYSNGKVNIPSGISYEPSLSVKNPQYNHATAPYNYQLLPADSRGYVRTDLSMNFKDETNTHTVNVYPKQGKIKIFEYRFNSATGKTEGRIWKTIDITDPSVVFFNNIVTIKDVILRDNINRTFGNEKECYYVLIDRGAISNGHPTNPKYWDGISSPDEWRFQTGNDDEFAAGYNVISPNIKRDGLRASNLSLSEASTVIAEFNEGTKAIINPTGKVQLFKTKTNSLVQQIVVTPEMLDGKRLTANFNTLEIGTNYFVVVQPGAFTDTSTVPTPNTVFGGVGSWEFRTIEPRNPVTTFASNVSTYGFTAKWDVFPDAITYYLDVSVDNAFTKCITGYHNRDVGNRNDLTLEGLLENTTYYYRVRARHPGGMTNYSNTMVVVTNSNSITILPLTVGVKSVESISVPGENDWFKFKSSNSGGTYTIQTFGNTDTYIEFFESDRKTIINFNDDDGELDNGKITQTLEADKWYYIKVRGSVMSRTTGDYSIRVDRVIDNTLSAPSNLSASIGNKQVSLFWTKPISGMPVSYTIFFKTIENEKFIRLTDTKEKFIIINELQNDKTYWYCIKAVFSNGESPISNIISVTPGYHPIIVNAPTYNSVLSLNGEIDAYKFKTTTSGLYTIETHGELDTYLTLFDYDATTQLHFNNDGGTNRNAKITYSLFADTWYYFEVKGVNSSVVGNYSVDVKGGEPLVLYPPSNVTATTANGKMAINWMTPDGAVPVGYNVYLGNSENGTYTLAVENTTDLSVTLSGLSNGIKYWAYVSAIYEIGESTASNKVYGIPSAGTPPPAPIALAPLSVGMDFFTANWGNTEGSTGYYIDISDNIDFTSFLTGFQHKNVGDVTSFSITGLTANTSYYYRVVAYNEAGSSNYSNVVMVHTSAAMVPSVPVAIAGTDVSAEGFTANWNWAENATGYFLDVSLNSSFSSFLPGFENKSIGNVCSFTLDGLETNTEYYYRIKAINLNGSSSYSNTISVRTLSSINCFNIISPKPGSTAVSLNPVISIEFCVDQIIVKPDGYIILSDQSMEQILGVNYFVFSLSDMLVKNNRIDIQAPSLKENMTYTVSIPYGVITDLAGNPFSGLPTPKYWMFSTGNSSLEIVTVQSVTIPNNASGTVTVTCSKAAKVYLVRNDVPQDVISIKNAIQQNKCKEANLLSPGSVVMNAENLLPGTYYVCAVEASGAMSFAENEVTVVSSSELSLKSIKQIQGEVSSSPISGTLVKVRGTIAAITNDGFFMQDDNAPWCGIFVRSTIPVGQNLSVEIVGTVAEINGMTAIDNVLEIKTILQVVQLQPIPITSSLTEKHEGVLCYITGKSSETKNTSGTWQAGDYLVDNSLLGSFSLEEGNNYGITGIVSEDNSKYKVLSTQIVNLTVGTNDFNIFDYTTLYPNPFNDQLFIQDAALVEKVTIFNQSGQFVNELMNPGQMINTSNLTKGLYIVLIHTTDGELKKAKVFKR